MQMQADCGFADFFFVICGFVYASPPNLFTLPLRIFVMKTTHTLRGTKGDTCSHTHTHTLLPLVDPRRILPSSDSRTCDPWCAVRWSPPIPWWWLMTAISICIHRNQKTDTTTQNQSQQADTLLPLSGLSAVHSKALSSWWCVKLTVLWRSDVEDDTFKICIYIYMHRQQMGKRVWACVFMCVCSKKCGF